MLDVLLTIQEQARDLEFPLTTSNVKEAVALVTTSKFTYYIVLVNPTCAMYVLLELNGCFSHLS